MTQTLWPIRLVQSKPSAIFPYNTILHCANSSLTKKIMVKAIDCI